MNKKSSRLIVNCGSSHVTAAKLSVQGKSLQLDKFVSHPFDGLYSKDEEWFDAVGTALKHLVEENDLSGSATFIIPGSRILTKIIKIPQIEAGRRAQIIAFEAQQKIPYSLNELVWDSQVLGEDGVETEVLFIACKTSTIQGFLDSVAMSGLAVEAISPATVLDYNVLELGGSSESDAALVVNIGASSTNFLFRNADGFFVRNIALGGNMLTQSIADRLNKSFSEAEAIKCQTFDSETNPSDEGMTNADEKEALSSCTDAFMRRLGQELTRSMAHYKRQKNTSAPECILLSGRGARLQGFATFLKEIQKCEFEYLEPLKEVTFGSELAHDRETLNFETSEIIGEACRSLLPEAVGVNLLPKETQVKQSFAAKKPFFAVVAIGLALFPWILFLGFNGIVSKHELKAGQLSKEIEPFFKHKEEMEQNRERALAIRQSIRQVEGLVKSKRNWILFFSELQDSLTQAEDVWLDNLKVERGSPGTSGSAYKVVLDGQMLVHGVDAGIDRNLLTTRVKSLQSSFETSAFVTSSQLISIKWTNLNQGLNVLPFTIHLSIDKDKPL